MIGLGLKIFPSYFWSKLFGPIRSSDACFLRLPGADMKEGSMYYLNSLALELPSLKSELKTFCLDEHLMKDTTNAMIGL